MRISRIRLSDKTSRGRPRTGLGKRSQAYQARASREIRVRKPGVLVTAYLVLVAQPAAEPTGRLSVTCTVALAHLAEANVPRPALQKPIDALHDFGRVPETGAPIGLGVESPDNPADALLRGASAWMGAARPRRVASPEGMTQEIGRLFRHATHSGLLLIHAQLDLRHQ